MANNRINLMIDDSTKQKLELIATTRGESETVTARKLLNGAIQNWDENRLDSTLKASFAKLIEVVNKQTASLNEMREDNENKYLTIMDILTGDGN